MAGVGRLKQASFSTDLDVGETLPVVGIVVDEKYRVRVGLKISNSTQFRHRNSLWLLVQRDEDRIPIEHEADRDHVWTAGRIDGGKVGHPMAIEKLPFDRGEWPTGRWAHLRARNHERTTPTR